MDERPEPYQSKSEWERMAGSLSGRVLRGLQRNGPSVAGRAIRITLWGVVHFCFVLVQQLAELLAPLMLIAGIGWYVLPRVIGMIQTGDGQMHDILNGLGQHVPEEITLAGHTITATGLIFDGILLMVIAAALSTATAVLANELYRDR